MHVRQLGASYLKCRSPIGGSPYLCQAADWLYALETLTDCPDTYYCQAADCLLHALER